MPPDLAFLLPLVLHMAVAAFFVVTASFITERSGPVIGALLATLPTNAATLFLGLTYVLLAQRHGVLASWGAAAIVWLALASLARLVHWSLAAGLFVNVIAFAICIAAQARYRHARMPPIARR